MPMYFYGRQNDPQKQNGANNTTNPQMKQSFSNNNQMQAFQGFGAPPANIDFKIDGLPEELQPQGLINPLALPSKKPMPMNDINNNWQPDLNIRMNFKEHESFQPNRNDSSMSQFENQ